MTKRRWLDAGYGAMERHMKATVSVLVMSSALCGLALSGCKKESETVGEAGVVRSSQTDEGPLPTLGNIDAFSFTNENGKTMGSKELAGTPYLATFFFTRCPTICPRVTARMVEVDQAVKKAGRKMNLVSISVDPENDTPEVMLAYAKKHEADIPNWSFLTGDYKTIAKTAEEGFKIGVAGNIDESKPHLGVTHGSHLVLVDAQGKMRGYFRSSDETTPSEVVKALSRL